MNTKDSPLLAVAREIVAAAGQTAAFETAGEFHLKIVNDPYLPLVIEAWPVELPIVPGERRRISVAHYVELNGDLCADPDIVLTDTGHVVQCQQRNHFTECIRYGRGYQPETSIVDAQATAGVEGLARMWARNLRAQGFIAAAKRLAAA